MLTPKFELSQSHDFLILTLQAPYVKTNDVDIHMEDFTFKFYAKPYFLSLRKEAYRRLTFSGRIEENGKESAKYDIHKGIFTIHIPKCTSGEHFANLDMLTLLMATKKKPPRIEVIASEVNKDTVVDSEESESEEFDWEIEQTLNTGDEFDGVYNYGFANKSRGVFIGCKGELDHVIDLPAPDRTSPACRRNKRVQQETEKFSVDHYIADLFDDEQIQQLLHWQPVCCESECRTSAASNDNDSCQCKMTEEERYLLIQLPHDDHALSAHEQCVAFFGLVDILFAFCYDVRTTEGEGNSESAWTICKLSSTLSWFERFSSIKDVLVCCARRALTFPLYRHWQLTMKVIDDVIVLLSKGKRHVLRSMLSVSRTLQTDENHCVLNALYIHDYCTWIQRVNDARLASLANNIRANLPLKEHVAFDLRKREKEALVLHRDVSSADESTSLDSDDDSFTQSDEEIETTFQRALSLNQLDNKTVENRIIKEE